jgi:hypothetical protein
MPLHSFRTRPAAIATVLAFASLLSCGREFTGPGAGRPGEVQLNPVFETVRLGGDGRVLSIADVVEFASVRVLLVRVNGDTVVDRVVAFPPDSTSIRLAFNVTLSQAATPEGEPLDATLKFINATGDTVFSGGPSQVLARSSGGSSAPPPEIQVRYVGTGADAAAITIAPTAHVGLIGTTVGFTAVVTDSTGAPMDSVPVAYTSTDSARVRVNLRTGQTQLLGARGSALIIAQTLTGQADTATVQITPSASAVVLVSGGSQSARQGSPFPLPVRVRVNAADAQPVAGVPVAFAVTRGQGAVTPSVDTTDVDGIAEAAWTAGDSAGVGNLTATVVGTTLNVVVTGSQLSSAPTALTFETQPQGIAAGATLDPIRVVVRDATQDTVRAYNGPVELSLIGGTAGASLVGGRQTAAVNGVVTFTGLTVDTPGNTYRLVATIPEGGPTAQSATFNVGASLPATVSLFSGGGQTVPPSTPLPDSIVVRVTDVFEAPKAGVTVNWSVTSGGGSVSPATSVTDANGRAAARWTAGAAGLQELRATVGQLEPVLVSAFVATSGGTPVLFLPVDAAGVSVGRTRNVTVFLTNPTPEPVTVDFTMRDANASWAAPQLVIPAGGTSVTAQIVGNTVGVTRAFVSSTAGSDSMDVNVELASVVIDGPASLFAVVSDTVRMLVRLEEPAPAGGVTVTVQSTDSAAVLLAPTAGDGIAEQPCYGCGGLLRADGPPSGALLAPPAGTATVTIAEGQLGGYLAILPVATVAGEGTTVPLTVSAPGFAGTGLGVRVYAATLDVYCYESCELGAGHRDEVWVYTNYDVRRDLPVRLRTLDPAIAIVRDSLLTIPRYDYNIDGVSLIGVSAGSTSLVVEAPGFRPETLAVTVRPPVIIGNGTVTLGLGAEDYIDPYLGYRDAFDNRAHSNGGAADRITVTATVRDPAVASMVFATADFLTEEYWTELRIRGEGVGSTYVVYSAPGHEPDSLQVVVTATSLAAYSQNSTVGVGQRSYNVYVTASNFQRARTVESAEVISTDPGVLRVLSPTINLSTVNASGTVAIEGVSAGTASVVIRRPGVDSAVVPITVVTPVLQFGSPSGAIAIPGDSALRSTWALLGTGSYYYGASDTLRAVLRSTDPTVVEVVDSIIVFGIGNESSYNGRYRAVRPGTAQLLLSAPGHTGATSGVITVTPPSLTWFNTSTSSTGRGLRLELGLQRGVALPSELPVTFTVQGTGGSTIRQAVDTIEVGSGAVYPTLIGGPTLGVDTVIATAPGYAADTLVVSIVPSSLDLTYYGTLTSGDVDANIGGYLYAPFGYIRSTEVERRFHVISRDTMVLQVVQDTIGWEPDATYSTRRAAVRGGTPGTTWLVATSVDGSIAGDSVQMTVLAPRLYSYTPSVTLGMQQQTLPDEFYLVRDLPRPSALWVRLTSSRPEIASVPDSVLIPANGYLANYQITAGDTTGSARVTFSAPGYTSGSVDVFVVRGTLVLDYDYDLSAATRSRVWVNLEAGYYEYPLSVPLPVALATNDAGVVSIETDTLVIPAGAQEPTEGMIRGHRVGRTSIRAIDARGPIFPAAAPAELLVEVYPATLKFGDDEYSVPVGTRQSDADFVVVSSDYTYVDSTWIRVRALGDRVRLDRDSVLFTLDESYGYLKLEGLVAGTDTLVVEAPGWTPDTIEVFVRPGILMLPLSSASSVRLADSTAVDVYLLASDGEEVAPSTAPITVTLSTSASLQTTLGPGPISSINVPVGATRATFWVKGLTVGAGTLTVSAPGFASATFSITTRSP